MKEILTELYSSDDLGMYYCGKRVETPNHIYGPEIRTHYLFVLVDSGKAVLYGDQERTFGRHDLLVMLPNERIHYKALEPWSIRWLGLHGKAVDRLIHALGVTPQNPIIPLSQYHTLADIMEKIYATAKDRSLSSGYAATALIYEFFSVLAQDTKADPSGIDPIKTARQMIDFNYSTPISIEQIAQRLSLDAAYFSRLFSAKAGISPKQYLLRKRMERAKALLEETNATVLEISNSVGYEDPLYFSRIFKKHCGVSPMQYRKSRL